MGGQGGIAAPDQPKRCGDQRGAQGPHDQPDLPQGRRHPQVRLLNDVVLNQVLVRFSPLTRGSRTEDAFTQEVVAGVQAEGTCWLGSTMWQGKRAARISICNWSTTEEDIERSAAAILRVVEQTNNSLPSP